MTTIFVIPEAVGYRESRLSPQAGEFNGLTIEINSCHSLLDSRLRGNDKEEIVAHMRHFISVETAPGLF